MLKQFLHKFWGIKIIYGLVKSATKAYFELLKLKRTHKKPLIIIALFEHIGDIVACEPVIGHLKETYKNSLVVWCINKNYASLLKYHPEINGIIELNCLSEWIFLKKLLSVKNISIAVVDLHINGRRCTRFNKILKTDGHGISFANYLIERGILQSFSISAGLKELDLQPKFYVKPGAVPDIASSYVIFHTSSNSPIKDWQHEKWQQLAEILTNSKIRVIEIGVLKAIYLDSPYFIDKTGHFDLQYIATLISNATLFVGCDSGFAHMANSLGVDGLVLIGEYKVDGSDIFSQYNPFTGRYKSSEYIVYSGAGPVKTIPVRSVTNRIAYKFKNNPIFQRGETNESIVF